MYSISILPNNYPNRNFSFQAKTPSNGKSVLPKDEVIVSSKEKKKKSVSWKTILIVGGLLLVALEALSERRINKDLKTKIQNFEKEKEISDKLISELDKDTKKLEEDLKKKEQELENFLKNLKNDHKK